MAVSLYSSGSTDALLAAKLSDAPIDGSTYGRLDGAWSVVAGGGGLTVNDLSNGATATLNATVPTTGQALTYDGTDLKWATVGGAAVIDIQTFSTVGTTSWTKPAGAKLVVGYMWGAGSGGGSGAQNATTGIRSGGGGGAGGSFVKFTVDASVLSASESVVIGAGGPGGLSQTTPSTAGIASTAGGVTSFANRFRCSPATNAGGGALTAVTAGASTSAATLEGILNSTTGINTGGTGNAGGGAVPAFSALYYYHSSGGGGGSGAPASTTTNRDGGPGGTKPAGTITSQAGLFTAIAGGSGGTAAGVSATTGTNGSLSTGGGTGGGGGAYRTGVAGMAGANGIWGSGGGGGGASDNGFASGAGGAGGSGALILITYF